LGGILANFGRLIDFDGRPYNILTLACEGVYMV